MIQILLVALLSLLVQWVLPWWSMAIVAFAVCYWRSPTPGRAFWYGLAGVALVWLAYALLVHVRTDGIFTGRMSQLLFKADVPVLLLLVTGFVSGLVGGLAGLVGHFVRQAVGNRPSVRNA